MIGGCGKVIWGHIRWQSVFTNNSWQDGDRDAQMLPNDLARQFCPEDMHIDLHGSWPDLDLTRPVVIFWNWPFSVKRYISEPPRRGKHQGRRIVLSWGGFSPSTYSRTHSTLMEKYVKSGEKCTFIKILMVLLAISSLLCTLTLYQPLNWFVETIPRVGEDDGVIFLFVSLLQKSY